MTYIITITSQGQISIPAPIRRKLKLDQTKKAIVKLHGSNIIIHPIPDILKFEGIFKTDKKISASSARQKFEKYLAAKTQ